MLFIYSIRMQQVYGYEDITKWKNQYEIILQEEQERQTQNMESE